MTHYEELGVRADASETEIRQAYRQLTRLLHPDQQTDPDLRLAAERQMRRLNAIHAVLTNPVERASYDAFLTPLPNSKRRRYWWIPPIAAALILIAWPFDRPAPAPPQAESAVPAPNPRLESRRTRLAPRTPPNARPVSVDPPPATSLPPSQVATAAPLPAPPIFSEPTALPPLELPPRGGIGGTWYFAASSNEPSDKLYSPEYIETVITERPGSIRGRYRARYRVGDRAISPFVAFEFEGKSADGDASFPWLGPAGARGNVRLKMLADSRLEISWSAEHLGAEMGLAAGRAVLSRAR